MDQKICESQRRGEEPDPDKLVHGHGLRGLGALTHVVSALTAVAPVLGTLANLAPLHPVLLPLASLNLLALLGFPVLGKVLALAAGLAGLPHEV